MANILIIDDSTMSRNKLKKILDSGDHRVIAEARDGVEGLQKYKELSPDSVDLVTLDVTMPNMDGLQCLKEILAVRENAKVVMITALGKGDTMLDALNGGAASYITKPFEDSLVLDAINEALRPD
jgi:two-component system chemotaxis response regulator CheY